MHSIASSLEPQARALYEAGATRWGDVHLAYADFRSFLAHDARRPLPATNACDAEGLFLACACLRGDAAALRHFEAEHGALFTVAVPHRLRPVLPDDFASATRERLLVGGPNRAPTLAKYSGRGALGGWLRVMIFRHAISVARRQARWASPLHAEFGPAACDAEAPNPEALYLREESRQKLCEAVASAWASLSQFERRLVHDSCVCGQSTRALAAAHEVHHATVARWLARASAKLFEQIRRRFGEAGRRGEGLGDALDAFGDVPLELTA